MKPFMCNGRRFAFDITNPHDLMRLERATDALKRPEDIEDGIAYPAYLCATPEMDANENAATMLLLCRRYYAFFSILFPGQAETLLGDRASIAHARDIFTRWVMYLEECVLSERESNLYAARFYEDRAQMRGTASVERSGFSENV